MPSTIGLKIRELRLKLKLTLDDLADLTGSSKSYIWEMENKEAGRPSAKKLERIATALGVTTGFLLDDGQAHPTEDVVDQAFYIEYRKADHVVKERMRRILKVLCETDDGTTA